MANNQQARRLLVSTDNVKVRLTADLSLSRDNTHYSTVMFFRTENIARCRVVILVLSVSPQLEHSVLFY